MQNKVHKQPKKRNLNVLVLLSSFVSLITTLFSLYFYLSVWMSVAAGKRYLEETKVKVKAQDAQRDRERKQRQGLFS
jgi:hypothetical protein